MPNEPSLKPLSPRIFGFSLLLILLVGIVLRVVPSAGFKGVGFDEVLYRNFVVQLDAGGLGSYPAICHRHIVEQSDPQAITKLPPTRFLYIFSAWLWKRAEFGSAPPLLRAQEHFVSHDPALVSLHRVAMLFSIFTLILAAIMAGRFFDRRSQLGITALIAFSPLLLQMSQHALVDGFFTFWAMLVLWLLWENLCHPDDWRWLTGFAAALALLVLTKENSFFVYISVMGLLVANIWAHFGKSTLRLWTFAILGPATGVLLLILLAGGIGNFIHIYQLLVGKAQHLEYAIATGDGPWYRYLVDLMILSPLVLCLAIAGFFTLVQKSRSYLYLVGFVVFSYAIMCNIPYAMNLRYATIWDFTLRALAFGQLVFLTDRFGKRQGLILLVALIALCAYDLNQYVVFFVDGKLYELVTSGLLQCVKILKFQP